MLSFFFQAEDGIRDIGVTGVQTCALPICDQHTVGVKSNGTLVAWGYNADGQTNYPAGVSNVLAVAAGQSDSLALIGDAPAIPALRAEAPAYLQGVFSVLVQTRSGKDYRLEYKDHLDDPVWNEL